MNSYCYVYTEFNFGLYYGFGGFFDYKSIMKLITVLFLALLAVATYAKFEKKVFLDFKSIIDHVNSVQKSWTAGHNKYFDGMDL